jgi:hypothetical protein
MNRCAPSTHTQEQDVKHQTHAMQKNSHTAHQHKQHPLHTGYTVWYTFAHNRRGQRM